ncbi:MAG: hypothetical protein Q4G66_00820 [bacterium]|nr:hypothetical protein [bacterium]
MINEDALKVKFRAINKTWLALLASILSYAVVGWYVGTIERSLFAHLLENVQLLGYIVSASILFGSLFFRKKLLFSRIDAARRLKGGNALQAEEVVSLYTGFVIISSAVSEVSAIFGLALCFMGIDKEIFLLFIIASAMAMVLNRPRMEELQHAVEYAGEMS